MNETIGQQSSLFKETTGADSTFNIRRVSNSGTAANQRFRTSNPATLLMAEKLRDAVIGSASLSRKEAQFEGEQERVQPVILQTPSTD